MIKRLKKILAKKPITHLGHLDILDRIHNGRTHSAHKYLVGNSECIVGTHENTQTHQFAMHLTKNFISHEIGTFKVQGKTIQLKLPTTLNPELGAITLKEIKRHCDELHHTKIVFPYAKKFEKIAIGQGYKREGNIFVLEV